MSSSYSRSRSPPPKKPYGNSSSRSRSRTPPYRNVPAGRRRDASRSRSGSRGRVNRSGSRSPPRSPKQGKSDVTASPKEELKIRGQANAEKAKVCHY